MIQVSRYSITYEPFAICDHGKPLKWVEVLDRINACHQCDGEIHDRMLRAEKSVADLNEQVTQANARAKGSYDLRVAWSERADKAEKRVKELEAELAKQKQLNTEDCDRRMLACQSLETALNEQTVKLNDATAHLDRLGWEPASPTGWKTKYVSTGLLRMKDERPTREELYDAMYRSAPPRTWESEHRCDIIAALKRCGLVRPS